MTVEEEVGLLLENVLVLSLLENPETSVELVDLVSSMSMALEQPQIEDCPRIVREAPAREGQRIRTVTPDRAARSELSQASEVYSSYES